MKLQITKDFPMITVIYTNCTPAKAPLYKAKPGSIALFRAWWDNDKPTQCLITKAECIFGYNEDKEVWEYWWEYAVLTPVSRPDNELPHWYGIKEDALIADLGLHENYKDTFGTDY